MRAFSSLGASVPKLEATPDPEVEPTPDPEVEPEISPSESDPGDDTINSSTPTKEEEHKVGVVDGRGCTVLCNVVVDRRNQWKKKRRRRKRVQKVI